MLAGVSAALLLPYLLTVLLMTVTPGPDTVLVIRSGLARGRWAALLTAVGCASGLLVWGLAAGLGITGLAAASTLAYTVLRLAGALYLGVLGCLLLWHAVRGEPRAAAPSAAPRSWFRGDSFAQGLVNNLVNPKAAAFFAALLPQFLPQGGVVLGDTLLLAAIAAVGSAIGLSVYGLLASGAGSLLRHPRARRFLAATTGGVLVGLGVRLALDRGRV